MESRGTRERRGEELKKEVNEEGRSRRTKESEWREGKKRKFWDNDVAWVFKISQCKLIVLIIE